MGSAVNRDDLGRLLEAYHDAGFGGVEITPIYGVKGYEDRYIDYLSPEWMDMLRFTTGKAAGLGMQADMNLGTGWPFGGPQVSIENAASKLIIKSYIFPGSSPREMEIIPDNPCEISGGCLMALTAYDGKGSRVSLPGRVDSAGILTGIPPGTRTIYAAFCGKTGQRVKRAAPGGEGYTLDPLSKEAMDEYLQRFDSAFGRQDPGVRSYFNDSYEVYDADFSPGLFDVFQQNRGYDARLWIRELAGYEDNDTVKRIKADYRQTVSEMLLDNFTRPWSDWIHGKNGLSRNQAHGSPGNLLDLYAAVDIPECETFGRTAVPVTGLHEYSFDTVNIQPDPVMLKFASSAGNVNGKTLISSETFTWLGEHFRVPLSSCKPQAEVAFLAGVNHIIYHGTTYSPASADWPGWLFYASVNFSPSNSFWKHIKGLNDYITRCQSVLQAGQADNDILLYWPVQDIWHSTGKPGMQLAIHDIDSWLYPTPFYRLARSLADSGYSADYVSDRIIAGCETTDGKIRISKNAPSYRVIVVPETIHMPTATLEKLLDLAKKGATVIFEKLPADVPGFNRMAARREKLRNTIDSLSFKKEAKNIETADHGDGLIIVSERMKDALRLAGVERETLRDSGLEFIRRKINGDSWYYVVNHTARDYSGNVPLNAAGHSALLLDPLNGRYGLASFTENEGKSRVRLDLKSGQTIFVCIAGRRVNDMPRWNYTRLQGDPLLIKGPWKLSFKSGGPVLPPARELDSLVLWTGLSDSATVWFSGTAEYSAVFTIDSLTAPGYLLDLGDVRESARVLINGKEAGTAWNIPAQLHIDSLLSKGRNTITIEVANLMANRIRYMDRHGIEWRNFHEINFVNLEYKPFDASGWEPLPSGLGGPVRIIPLYYGNE